MKDNHYKFSSSFQTAFIANKNNNSKQKPSVSKSHEKKKQLFSLNPKLGSAINQLPIDVMRKKSKQKLESLKDLEKQGNKWSIFNEKIDDSRKNDLISDKKIGKTYNLDLNKQENRRAKSQTLQNEKIIQQLPKDIVRPSIMRKIDQQPKYNLKEPSIFQTPFLPCFPSEFNERIHHKTPNKQIHEKDGIWKIGKIKIYRNKNNQPPRAQLNINGIQFEANMADIEGKAANVSQNNFHQLPNWNGFWIVEPKEEVLH